MMADELKDSALNNQKPLSNDTAQDVQSTSQPTSEVHEESQDTSASMETPTVEDYKEKYERIAGKVSELEKTANESKQQAEFYTKFVASDPEVVKKAFMFQGLSEAEAQAKISEIQQANPQLWSQTQQNQNAVTQQQPSFDPALIGNYARTSVEKELAYRDFFSAVPSMNPENIKSEDEKASKQKIAEVVEARAYELTGGRVPKGSDLVKAYNEITKAFGIEEVKQQARLEGLASHNADNASNFSASTPSQPSKGSVSLSPVEAEMARSMGLTPEQYAEGKNL